MDNEGETALIPSEMVTYSMSAAPTINLEATLRLLATPAQMPAEVPNSAAADPLIRYVSALSFGYGFQSNYFQRVEVYFGFQIILYFSSKLDLHFEYDVLYI